MPGDTVRPGYEASSKLDPEINPDAIVWTGPVAGRDPDEDPYHHDGRYKRSLSNSSPDISSETPDDDNYAFGIYGEDSEAEAMGEALGEFSEIWG